VRRKAYKAQPSTLGTLADVISGEYVDYESGRKGQDKRKRFAALFDDAAKRKFDCVLFWALEADQRHWPLRAV
jgi:DNA invertase Pin-like site-specific DNA recombinase